MCSFRPLEACHSSALRTCSQTCLDTTRRHWSDPVQGPGSSQSVSIIERRALGRCEMLTWTKKEKKQRTTIVLVKELLARPRPMHRTPPMVWQDHSHQSRPRMPYRFATISEMMPPARRVRRRAETANHHGPSVLSIRVCWHKRCALRHK